MDWNEIITNEQNKPYYKTLSDSVQKEYQDHTCYPPIDLIFNAFIHTPYDKIKVVILGQDPYHEPRQAMGLSFSVPNGVTIPPSLQNIYKEICNEYGQDYPVQKTNGDLTRWADQGVLLLNTTLTVREHVANSHLPYGWTTFTDAIIKAVEQNSHPIVYMLWGKNAKDKKSLITNPNHLILESPHPSPFSADRGFFGNGHFKACNDFLSSHGQTPINWT